LRRIQAHLTKKQIEFIEKSVEKGSYETTAEAIRDAVDCLMNKCETKQAGVGAT